MFLSQRLMESQWEDGAAERLSLKVLDVCQGLLQVLNRSSTILGATHEV